MADFPKKLEKLLPEGFTDAIAAATKEEMDEMIVKCEEKVYEITKEIEKDATLSAAKERVKDLAGAYRDAQKTQQAKIRYIIFSKVTRGYI